MIRNSHVESVEEFTLDLVEDAVLILEENEIICSSNRAFERLTNLPRASLRGKKCNFAFLTLEEQYIFMNCLMESLQTNSTVSYGPFHFTAVGKTDSKHLLCSCLLTVSVQYITANFNPFDNGKTRYCICVFQTLTQEVSERFKYLVSISDHNYPHHQIQEQFERYSEITGDILEYDPFLHDLLILFHSTRSLIKFELGKYIVRFSNRQNSHIFLVSRPSPSSRSTKLSFF